MISLVLIAGLLVSSSLAPPDPGPPQIGGVPKTVILGFDGMDHALTGQFMAAGDLPNFARLAEQGTFQRLETTNPAQSAVSWAVFNTGSNPGKTGVGGFVGRKLGSSSVQPQLMLGFSDTIDAAEFVAFPMAMKSRGGFLALVAGGALVIGLLLFRVLFRLPTVVALVLALGAAGVGGWQAMAYIEGLPADGQVPYVVNPMQATNYWSYLDAEGVRFRGIQVSSTYPPDAEGPNVQLLSGLGTPDIGGSPGTFYIYTDDPWTLKEGTSNGGKLVRLYEDEPGIVNTELFGPRNWIEKARFEHERTTLETQKNNPRLSSGEVAELDQRIDDVKNEERRWRSQGDRAALPLVLRLDRDGGRATIEVGGQSFDLGVGEWSDFIPVEFVLNSQFSAYGVARFHLLRCDQEELRIFVPPISIDPSNPPPWLPISSPPEFAGQLVQDIGQHYETLGWGCMTNPLKDIDDTHFGPQSFIDDLADNVSWRNKILEASLDDADQWDVYFQLYGDTDRMAHMLFREFDPSHPAYDAEYARQQVTMFGETFPLDDSIRQIYREADRIVGRVLERMDAGELGDGALLMIVSDHGFTSWRRSINLNNILAENGWLALKDGMTLDEYLESGRPMDILQFVDWENTKAYSMGLGKVFVNLQGREPKGIVPPAEYDQVVDAIRAELMEVEDESGTRVFTSLMRRDELFSGPWWEEGRATRLKRGQEEEVANDGFADLFVGFVPFHRIAGSTTMGGLGRSAIIDNEGHWSGDHVSVDPDHVPGVLFTSQPVAESRVVALPDIGPTVLQRYGLDPAETDMDGTAIPFADR